MKKMNSISMLLTITVIAFNTAPAFALPAVQNDDQPQIEVVNDPITAPVQKTAPVQSQSNSQSSTNTNTTTVQQPVVFQNRPTNNFQQQQQPIIIQKQAQTVVEDSPLNESAADRLRKKRLEAEQETESKIVEKLEIERIQAEKIRAAKVLGALDEEKKKEDKPAEVVAAPVAAAVVVAPAAPIAAAATQQAVVAGPQGTAQGQSALQEQSGVNGSAVQTAVQNEGNGTVVVEQADQIKNIKTEEQAAVIAAPVQEMKTEAPKEEQPERRASRMFVSGNVGFISYPSLQNIQTTAGGGFTVGSTFDERYTVEGSFLYSKSQIEDVFRPGVYDPYYNTYFPTYESMDQYMVSATFKYNILGESSRFSPHVGGTLAYIYRSYKDTQSFDTYNQLQGNSWGINAGLVVGADLRLSDNFTLGADMNYLFNVSYQVTTSNGLQPSQIMYNDGAGQPIEKVSLYTFLINLKYRF